MSTPATPPGWYPDPSGQPGQRYFDGLRWTQHFTPHAPAAPAPAVAVAVANAGGGGSNGGMHVVHLLLTLLTCGLWLPIWIIFAIIEGVGGSRPSTAVAVGGVPAYPQMQSQPVYGQPVAQQASAAGTVSSVAKWLGMMVIAVVAAFFGLLVLFMIADYPVLLVLALPALIGGGAFFWKHKAKERELRERELADAVAERADRENQLAQEGDPRGTHGRYMPPPKDLS